MNIREEIKMNKVKLFSDSTCDLSFELIEKYNITVIPLYINIGEETFADLEELQNEQLFEIVKKTKIHPKTSAVAPGVFIEEFQAALNEGYDVVYMGIGGGFSGTLQSAHTAKLELDSDRIFLIDSQNLSSGSGLLLMRAAKMVEEGKSAAEIVSAIEDLKPRVRTQFVIDTLEYLHRGGRCSATARIFGTALKVHPIIRVVDGAMTVAKKPRGTLLKAVDVMMEYLEKDRDNLESDLIFITHAQAQDIVPYVREKIKMVAKFDNIVETKAGSVISSHCGPQTIGILYITKS